MPIYVYKGNSQVSTNAIRNNKAVKAIYAKEQGKDAVCVWGVGLTTGFLTYTKDATSVTITGLKQGVPWTFLIIPDTIENLPVTTIASLAFNENTNLKHIELPNSLTNIGGSAFRGCTGLTNITIPNSVTSIGNSVFSGCSSLENITIPFVGAKAGVTSSDTYQYPFGYIFGTSSYTGGVETGQTYYESSTSSTKYSRYYIPSSLESVTVSGGNILRGAFNNCKGLTSVTILDSVTSIGRYAFEGCSGLTSITIPNGVTSISEYVFSGCTGLKSVTIPDSVTRIGEYAFSQCIGLNSIIFNGTRAQWATIYKVTGWNIQTGNYTIHCTDGDIPK